MGYSYGGQIKLDQSIEFLNKTPLDIRVVVPDYESLAQMQNPYVGLITYVEAAAQAFVCKSVSSTTGTSEWIKIKGASGGIHVGPNPPDTADMTEDELANLLWVDTNNDWSQDNMPTEEGIETAESLRRAYFNLKEQVNILKNLTEHGVVPGKVTDSARNKIRWNLPGPTVPQAYLWNLLDDGYVYDAKNGGKIYEYVPEYDTSGNVFWPYDDDNNLTIKVNEDDLIYDPTEEDSMDFPEEKPSYPVNEEPTVPHVCVKYGTWTEISNNRKNFYNGELIWCTDGDNSRMYIYMDGNFKLVGNGGTGSGEEDEGMTEVEIRDLVNEELLQNIENGITFIPADSTGVKYKVDVDKYGNLKVYNSALDIPFKYGSANYAFTDTANYQAATGVVISTFYLGGIDKDEHSYQSCSHNFVELANVSVRKDGTQPDINLNGWSLCYFNGAAWKECRLKGEIKGGGTYLIRGAQCSVMDANTTLLKVKTYDQIWADTNTDGSETLVKFSQDKAVFYLVYTGEDHVFYTSPSTNDTVNNVILLPSKGLWDATNGVPKGYGDLVSFNYTDLCEKSTFTLSSYKGSVSDIIFRRWYLMDPVTQSNPKDGVLSHNNVKYMTATSLTGGTIPSYMDASEWTPKASYEHRTMAQTRSHFDMENKPQILTCTFGCQATYKSANRPATRGFAWVSPGYYNEYLMIRKKGTTAYTKFESLTGLLDSVPTTGIRYSKVHANQSAAPYYYRLRWETPYGESVTTHRVILTGFTAGEYEYYVARENSDYRSEDRKFKVRADSEVSTKFTYIQTTDQQGASWEEYEVWSLSAEIIAREAKASAGTATDYSDYNFIINTGDICYNGSRPNEWIDYFRGYAPLNDHEEMLTIGNNDLAPINMYDIGTGGESPWKINVEVIDYFYAVEIDLDNPQIFTGPDAKLNVPDGEEEKTQLTITFKMPSLYSFNYGPYHYISILSEIRTGSSKVEYVTNEDGSYVLDENGNPTVKESSIAQNTVNTIFGMKDYKRYQPERYMVNGKLTNCTSATAIYDMQERWVIKDVLKWKKTASLDTIDSASIQTYLTSLDTQSLNDLRFNELKTQGALGTCQRCFFYIHEMPFNITATSSYENYAQRPGSVPRETAKAYLNRFHNFEYQRLFKLLGIRLVMGGHKHTVAMTRPVYDAPIGYNPLTKKIERSEYASATKTLTLTNGTKETLDYKWDDDLFNDFILDQESKGTLVNNFGTFSYTASFQPFIQMLASDMTGTQSHWERYCKTLCAEVYNNTSNAITINTGSTNTSVTIPAKGKKTGITLASNNGINGRPNCRVEIVDTINAPSYVMCQATGFKNKSNSDLAATTPHITWERYYVEDQKLQPQCYPYYTVYVVEAVDTTDVRIQVNMIQIQGMYSAGKEATGSSAGYWDLAKIYGTYPDSLEANRKKIIDGCTVVLYAGEGNASAVTI